MGLPRGTGCLGTPCSMAGRALTVHPAAPGVSLQSSTQEIGEELVNGVVYSISLRKVQVHHAAGKGQRRIGVSVGDTCLPGTAPTFSQGSPARGPHSPAAPRPAPPRPGPARCSHCWHMCVTSERTLPPCAFGALVRLARVSCFGGCSPPSPDCPATPPSLTSPHFVGRAVFTPKRMGWGGAALYTCL